MPNRRRFILSASTLTAAAVGAAAGRNIASKNPAGELVPIADATTGLPLLKLPQGFRYSSYSWTGDTMLDGNPVPKLHDGMGAFRGQGQTVRLVRNHEIGSGRNFCKSRYDESAGGGTTTLVFDQAEGAWQSCEPSLSGTVRNCSGGPTPWGSWLTCEEPQAEFFWSRFAKSHGWVFEVPALGLGSPKPIEGLGRFRHEAAVVDPLSGTVYQTEDKSKAGFYRFLPKVHGNLHEGGRLQMLAIDGRPGFDARRVSAVGEWLPVSWVDIDDPSASESADPARDQGVAAQGWKRGGAVFRRLEGCWVDADRVYFVSTNGGRTRHGQIWELSPSNDRLRLIYESPGGDVLDGPDNLSVAPNGGLVLCENGRRAPTRLCMLTENGRLFPIAENHILLRGQRGLRGNFTGEEWCGACSHGDWLFANIQVPGITFAITGPWALLGTS